MHFFSTYCEVVLLSPVFRIQQNLYFWIYIFIKIYIYIYIYTLDKRKVGAGGVNEINKRRRPWLFLFIYAKFFFFVIGYFNLFFLHLESAIKKKKVRNLNYLSCFYGIISKGLIFFIETGYDLHNSLTFIF